MSKRPTWGSAADVGVRRTLVPSYLEHETYRAFFRYVRVFGGGGLGRKFES